MYKSTQYLVLRRRYDHKNIGNNSKAKYAFDGKKVRFTYNKNTIYTCDATYGDCFKLTYFNKGLYVEKFYVPKDRNQLILWILGFKKENRVSNKDGEIFSKIQKRRLSELRESSSEMTFVEDNSILCYVMDKNRITRVVGYVDKDISKDEIIELFNKHPGIEKFDRNLIEDILRSRLYFDEDDIDRLENLRF